MARRNQQPTARVVNDEPVCDCADEHRVDVHLESTDGYPAIANLCTRCGRIHRLPANARVRERHDEDTETERMLNRVLAADRANALRLQEEMLDLYERIERERDEIARRVEMFRRRYPQPPAQPSAHYRDALAQYEADIERLRELEMAEAHANETLGMLGMQEDPDPEQFERVRAMAGMPSLATIPSEPDDATPQDATPSEVETTDSQATDAPANTDRRYSP
jgi:uncharacterized coiled-coil protein SlyX